MNQDLFNAFGNMKFITTPPTSDDEKTSATSDHEEINVNNGFNENDFVEVKMTERNMPTLI